MGAWYFRNMSQKPDDHRLRMPGACGHASLYPWYVALLMGASYAVSFVDRALVSVASAPIKQDLALGDSQYGLLNGTAFVILYCLCGIPLGLLADRVDRRAMIALGILFWTGMTAICGLSISFAAFFVARVGVGLGEASLVPAGMSLLGSIVPRSRMARSVAIFLMGAAIGNGGALLVGGYLLTDLTGAGPLALPLFGPLAPWRLLFLIACLPGLVMAALVMTLREPSREPLGPTTRPGLRAALSHVGTNPKAYGFLSAATACTIILAQAPGAWMPLFYVRHFALQPGASAMAIGAIVLMSAPTGQLAGGILTDRLQAHGVPGAQNTVMALCLFLALFPAVVFCTTGRLWLSEVAYGLYTLLVSAATPTGLAGLQMLAPPRYRGILSALLVSVVTLVGVGLGPVAIGLLTEYGFQDEQALGLSLLIVILAAGLTGPALALGGRRSFARTAGSHDPLALVQ
jgi:MFS family permease